MIALVVWIAHEPYKAQGQSNRYPKKIERKCLFPRLCAVSLERIALALMTSSFAENERDPVTMKKGSPSESPRVLLRVPDLTGDVSSTEAANAAPNAIETTWTWNAAPKVSLAVLVLAVTALGAFVFREREDADAPIPPMVSADAIQKAKEAGKPDGASGEKMQNGNNAQDSSPRLARREPAQNEHPSAAEPTPGLEFELPPPNGFTLEGKTNAADDGNTTDLPRVPSPDLSPIPSNAAPLSLQQAPAANGDGPQANEQSALTEASSRDAHLSQRKGKRLPRIVNGGLAAQQGVVYPTRATAYSHGPTAILASESLSQGTTHERR